MSDVCKQTPLVVRASKANQSCSTLLAVPGTKFILTGAVRTLRSRLATWHSDEQPLFAANNLHVPNHKFVVEVNAAVGLQDTLVWH